MTLTAAKRLASLEMQFSEIERLTKELRKRLDRIAETVRITAEELLQSVPKAGKAHPAPPLTRTRRKARKTP